VTLYIDIIQSNIFTECTSSVYLQYMILLHVSTQQCHLQGLYFKSKTIYSKPGCMYEFHEHYLVHSAVNTI